MLVVEADLKSMYILGVPASGTIPGAEDGVMNNIPEHAELIF